MPPTTLGLCIDYNSDILILFERLLRIFAGLLLVFLLGGGLFAQQREPAFEVYGVSGTYFHGNQGTEEWKPQFGAGVFLPLGRKWGALLDVTTSVTEEFWKPDGLPGAGPDDNFTRERRIVLTPSIVRLWRWNRFSIYAGGGVGFEHERQRGRFRPIVDRDENGQPILAEHFQDIHSNRTPKTLLLRTGVIVNLSRSAVFRAGFSLLPRYADEDASKSVELGVGFRF